MKQPTIDQILACDDEAQLNEWCAVIFMGWFKKYNDHEEYTGVAEYVDRNSELRNTYTSIDYNPCQDKAQAFDLMVKSALYPMKMASGELFFPTVDDIPLFNENELQIAIVKQSLCSAVSE